MKISRSHKALRALITALLTAMLTFTAVPATCVFADESQPEAPVVKAGTINKATYLYKSASTHKKKYFRMNAGDTVEITSSLGIFYKVKTIRKNKTYKGYVKRDDITLTSGSTADEPERVIYLTYDDNPGPNTDRLLQSLAENDVKATFFVTGNYTSCNPNIRKIHLAGHAVGAHSYGHNYNIYKSEKAFYEDLDRIQEVILEQTGSYTKLYRFPGGSSNTVSRRKCRGIMTKLTKSIQEHGYTYFDWNVGSKDCGSGKTKKKVYENVTRSMEGKNVGIVLMHVRKNQSVDATPDIIKWGKANGYVFKALTPDGYTVHARVNN